MIGSSHIGNRTKEEHIRKPIRGAADKRNIPHVVDLQHAFIIYQRRAPHHRSMKLSTVALTSAAAVAAGFMIGLAPAISDRRSTPTDSAAVVSHCLVTDGDTIRCGDERIRLLGIDAPELPGHCRGERRCAPGDPYASTSSLEAAMSDALHIERVGEDRYGRTLAMVTGTRGDLSCWQLSQGQAIYKPQWDDGDRVDHLCRAYAR